jgi:hypothetical protein
VRDEIQVQLNIPLQTETVVTLTNAVPLTLNASIDLPGINAYGVAATVNLSLPQGLELPVALDLDVAVDEPLPIALDVRAIIPLQQTQLHDPFVNLRLLFEPLARSLTNLPNNFSEGFDFVGDVLAGDVNLLQENDYSRQPWPGYSITAGEGYPYFAESYALNDPALSPNISETGIVPLGGIPFLDEQFRPNVYDAGGPVEVNTDAFARLQTSGLLQMYYDGQISNYMTSPDAAMPGGTGTNSGPDGDLGILPPQGGAQPTPQPGEQPPPNTGGPEGQPPAGPDMGIIPTPTGGG